MLKYEYLLHLHNVATKGDVDRIPSSSSDDGRMYFARYDIIFTA